MSKLTASLTALDAVATGIKTWLSGSTDLTHLTTFEDEELGKVVVGIVNEQLAKGEAAVEDDRWRPISETVPVALWGTFLPCTFVGERTGHRFVCDAYCDGWGRWRIGSGNSLVAWRRPLQPWDGR